MLLPPADLHPEAQKVVDLYNEIRWPDSKPLAYYRDLPTSNRLCYETLSWSNYRILLNLFEQDTSQYVMPSLKRPDELDIYVAYQLSTGRYGAKRGSIDWLLRLHDGTYVGVLHLYEISLEIWDGKRMPCMVGYAIAEPFRRQGYAEEALKHLLGQLPVQFLLYEARAEPLQTNAASCSLLKKTGFSFLRNFKNYWGQAALYHIQVTSVLPDVSFEELDNLIE
ncbi:GNAT family N-acetyltransferase [Spirosoma montaniterrae]|uniref:N-acetyltransferase domain-containing protein n=1 Tax=Spirosoma montaniterrae TaxID=1178516 RepID=A0A1P9X0I7_9BACT|nr:GNAT family N-acetyltransferase [Spirosoma montaniterrae]AQG81150.1 hypothetical protein AWR27_18585 [Spirosoma montaniterrae]